MQQKPDDSFCLDELVTQGVIMNSASSSIFACLAAVKKLENGAGQHGRIPHGCLLIGDSMIRNVDPNNLDAEVFHFAYPGIKARQLCNQIKLGILDHSRMWCSFV